MSRSTDQLLAEALDLPAKDRAHLAESLRLSLDEDPEDVNPVELEREWLTEVSRRATEIDSGAVRIEAADDVFEAARAELRAMRPSQG